MKTRFYCILATVLLVAAMAAPRPLLGRAIDQLTGGGPMPSVPDVPDPTPVDDGDRGGRGGREDPDPDSYTPQPQPAPGPTQEELRLERERLERERLAQERQEQERIDRERREREEADRQYQLRLEEARREAERVEQARVRALFEQKKQDLASAFRMAPAILPGTAQPQSGAAARISLPPDATPDQRCRQLLAVQAEIDQLETREGKLTVAERNRLGQAILRRNMLWRLAVTPLKRLDTDEREQLKLSLPVIVQRVARLATAMSTPPRVGPDTTRPLADPAAPVLQTMLATMNTDHLVSWVEDKGGDVIESGLGEEALDHYESLFGIAKVVLSTTQDGRAAGLAEGVDFVISKVATPGAGFAVTGGRQVAAVAFKAQTKFMEDAMLATGGTFDSKEFWQKLRGEFSTSGQAVFEWVGAPGGDE